MEDNPLRKEIEDKILKVLSSLTQQNEQYRLILSPPKRAFRRRYNRKPKDHTAISYAASMIVLNAQMARLQIAVLLSTPIPKYSNGTLESLDSVL